MFSLVEIAQGALSVVCLFFILSEKFPTYLKVERLV